MLYILFSGDITRKQNAEFLLRPTELGTKLMRRIIVGSKCLAVAGSTQRWLRQ